jgi:hypothetical protein
LSDETGLVEPLTGSVEVSIVFLELSVVVVFHAQVG